MPSQVLTRPAHTKAAQTPAVLCWGQMAPIRSGAKKYGASAVAEHACPQQKERMTPAIMCKLALC